MKRKKAPAASNVDLLAIVRQMAGALALSGDPQEITLTINQHEGPPFSLLLRLGYGKVPAVPKGSKAN